MEEVATESFRALASQGTGWLLFCIACAVAALLFRELLKTKESLLSIQKDCQTATEVIWRERLEEKEQALTVLHAGTVTNQKLAENLAAARQASDLVAQLITQMDQGQKVNDTHWRHWATATERTLADILTIVRDRRPG
jgi:PleD family two-component response regulator